jgi:hypothetical protein
VLIEQVNVPRVKPLSIVEVILALVPLASPPLMPTRMQSDARRGDHPRPLHIFKVVRYCVVNVLSPPNLVPAMLVALIRK